MGYSLNEVAASRKLSVNITLMEIRQSVDTTLVENEVQQESFVATKGTRITTSRSQFNITKMAYRSKSLLAGTLLDVKQPEILAEKRVFLSEKIPIPSLDISGLPESRWKTQKR